ncbi:MAG: hypothetical protein RLZZ67_168 [Candidatus Parcubacteria bacterium]|jgi:nucleoside-diphosphate-sugar epimerase
MKILISGATGFVGKNLVRALLEEGHEVCALVRESSDIKIIGNTRSFIFTTIENLQEFLQKERFEGIVHLATLFLGQHTSKDVPNLINSNILLGASILEAASKTNVAWLLNTSTPAQHYLNKAYSPVNLYAATKQAFEDIARYYIETSNLTVTTLELPDTFGSGDTRSKLFNIWLRASRTGETLDFPPGKQIVDITHIDNVTSAYVQLVNLLSKDSKKLLNGKRFSLYSTKRFTLKKLASIFEKASGKKLNIRWGASNYRAREIMSSWNKGVEIPGFKNKVSLEDGIKKLYE